MDAGNRPWLIPHTVHCPGCGVLLSKQTVVCATVDFADIDDAREMAVSKQCHTCRVPLVLRCLCVICGDLCSCDQSRCENHLNRRESN